MKLNYRPDIDGLRAIAVIGVLLFHAEVPGLTGAFVGVDVFFVISGYLISSILILELNNKGKIDFFNFWARRTRRLLPSALLVILVTILASYFISSNIQFYETTRDAIWASTYLINWTKLISAVQYFDEGGKHGPFLHYWSLAVEEQFYLIITFIFFIGITVKRVFQKQLTWPASKIIILLILITATLSFISNLYYISIAQPISFFGTHARVWELSLGVIVGSIERKKYIPTKAIRETFAWTGILLILSSYVLFTPELSYPGIYAIIPSVGTTLFLLAGINTTHSSLPKPLSILSIKPSVAIGKLSYSLYLWHWPIFVLWQVQRNSWNYLDISLALLLTWLLSYFFYTTLENPVRFSKSLSKRPKTSLIGASVITSLFVITAYQLSSSSINQNFIVLSKGNTYLSENIKRELPSIYRSKPPCHATQKETSHPKCVFGSEKGQKSILLFGDSHAAQWFPAFEKIATHNNFQLYSRTKSSCASIKIRQWNDKWKREYTECAEWRSAVLNEIKSLKIDYVILGNSGAHTPLGADGSLLKKDKRLKALADAERKTIEYLQDTGATVILMRDTPWHETNPLECLVENPRKKHACYTPSPSALRRKSPWSVSASSQQQGVHLIDMTKHFCWDNKCYVTDGNFVFHRDKHHVSKQYSLHLSGYLEEYFLNAISR